MKEWGILYLQIVDQALGSHECRTGSFQPSQPRDEKRNEATGETPKASTYIYHQIREYYITGLEGTLRSLVPTPRHDDLYPSHS